SIDGDTHHTFTEDVSARYRSYGWNVIEVAAKKDGDVDRDALEVAMQSALEEKIRPTLIRLKTVIAWPAPKARNTAKSHGSALGKEEVAATKLLLGLPEEDFYFPTEVHQHVRKVSDRSQSLRTKWNQAFESWKRENPAKSELLQRLESGSLPSSWQQGTPVFPSEKEVATRKASGELINHFAKVLPELIGGSADLAESNNTTVEGGGSFLPSSSILPGASPYGRNIFFGIREHAMGAILNGMALHGGLRPYAGTFLVFSDYMRGAVRLSALMKLPVIYVWTHDSIGLGEDGPTHQPIEHFAALRAIPGLDVIRPADANEVAIAWQEILRRKAPAGLLLSRQNLPVIDRASFNSADGVARGAYALNDEKNPELIIIATGSEVSLALAALSELTAKGVKTRVVSAPCLEWFKAQPESYKDELLPKSVKARVSVEAGIAQGWRDLIGDAGESISIEHFGASASHTTLFSEFGFTVKRVIEAAEATLKRVR
ncbi:MAG: transketolase, partial [Actinobacteria bacterium]|nr:transketolase [Actinomycetota bacterium]